MKKIYIELQEDEDTEKIVNLGKILCTRCGNPKISLCINDITHSHPRLLWTSRDCSREGRNQSQKFPNLGWPWQQQPPLPLLLTTQHVRSPKNSVDYRRMVRKIRYSKES